ncbi:M14 family metallopeptidase [Sedimenticola selenatireducens]|uniref:Deacylase n=1 Tax=Sedimenticola selenatireducens TaxID=191960 RepID=A0A557SBP0_9GAMM|nr:M14 family metallopeptidase [Sedimenticola selenatireducens]TVO74833.1 deacylase [Sedimenticola selenatireducens]TVT62368.1 MAG: deacylase [Sedimenticola selenatireducens]
MKQLTLLLLLLFTQSVLADDRLEFSLHKIDSGVPGPTILVVGGIQGDEPGGFHAASLLATDYQVTQGSIWVVPNLNFESIIKRSRGVYGDMNRKFARMKTTDPDYSEVERIKSLIRSPEVDFIFNMHDGSGFYRSQNIDSQHNPNRWGQSIIIDQEKLDTPKYSDVGTFAREVTEQVNQQLLSEEHRYHVKNTHTRQGNAEMEKTLTYYAINNGKAAVGIEASKNLPTHERVYYHLNALEAFMQRLGIKFTRSFKLEPLLVKQTIDNNIRIALHENRLLLDVAEARRRINYLPMKRDARIEFTASNPLVAITSKGNGYHVNYGNRNLTFLHPQFFEYDTSLNAIDMHVDGSRSNVNLGSIVTVAEHFSVDPLEGYRINVIGWTRKGIDNEVGYEIKRDHISRHFSVDLSGTLFRVEVYHEEKFCGMVLVKFAGAQEDQHASLEQKNES